MRFPKKIPKSEIESRIKEWRLSGLDLDLHHSGHDVEKVGSANSIDIWDYHPDVHGEQYLVGWYQLEEGKWYWYEGEDSEERYGEPM